MSLLVAGALHLDVVVRAPHLPALDETVAGSAVEYVFGGKGGNQAVAAARMGAQVAFAGRAGSDAFGDRLRAALAQAGVGCAQLQRDPGPSGMSVAILNAQGEYGAVIVSAANLLIDPGAITIPKDTRLVLLQNEVPERVNLELARKARAAGAQVWLNAAPARPLPPALLGLLDLLIVNRVEAAFYDALPDGLARLETRGAEGVCFAGESYAAPSVLPRSTHGAGDMFVGALASRVLAGRAISQAIPFAQAAAALHVVSDAAAREAMTERSVSAFLAGQQPNR